LGAFFTPQREYYQGLATIENSLYLVAIKSISMQKKVYLSVLVVILFACNKSDTDNNGNNVGLSTSPETKPQYNNTVFGVYKGVIIGSSGTIIFKINNGDNVVKRLFNHRQPKRTH